LIPVVVALVLDRAFERASPERFNGKCKMQYADVNRNARIKIISIDYDKSR